MPASRLAEIRRGFFAAARHRLGQQVTVAQPGHRGLQCEAVVVHGDRTGFVFGSFHGHLLVTMLGQWRAPNNARSVESVYLQRVSEWPPWLPHSSLEYPTTAKPFQMRV